MEIKEKDWKLFSARISQWQDAYMDKLNASYLSILTNDKSAPEKFHTLRDKINSDFNSPGVFVERKRSKLIENIASLLRDDVITMDDLSDFSEELKETVQLLMK